MGYKVKASIEALKPHTRFGARFFLAPGYKVKASIEALKHLVHRERLDKDYLGYKVKASIEALKLDILAGCRNGQTWLQGEGFNRGIETATTKKDQLSLQ